MKLKYNFVTNEVADKIVAVAVGADMNSFNGFIKMNEVGAEIFSLLKEEITIDEIVAKMFEKYPDAEEQEIRETVIDFTDKLKDAGVVDV